MTKIAPIVILAAIGNPLALINNVNTLVGKATNITMEVDSKTKIASKTLGGCFGCGMLARGSVDLVESIHCGDKICSVISFVGCTADCIQLATCFLPVLNVTTVVCAPVSTFCKVFVATCKGRKLPWGGCR